MADVVIGHYAGCAPDEAHPVGKAQAGEAGRAFRSAARRIFPPHPSPGFREPPAATFLPGEASLRSGRSVIGHSPPRRLLFLRLWGVMADVVIGHYAGCASPKGEGLKQLDESKAFPFRGRWPAGPDEVVHRRPTEKSSSQSLPLQGKVARRAG